MHGLPSHVGEDEQERQGQRQPPKACRNRSGAREADEPRSEGEQAAPDQKGDEGERLVLGARHYPRLARTGPNAKRLAHVLIAQFGVPAFIKVDVEGAEPAVLAGLTQGVAAAHRKWPTGIYLLWYPIKDPKRVARFHARLA